MTDLMVHNSEGHEFQVSIDDAVRYCLKNQNETKTNNIQNGVTCATSVSKKKSL